MYTWFDVVVQHSYVPISVRTTLFMPEAHSMTNFMNHNRKCNTASAQRYTLFSTHYVTNVRTTAVEGEKYTLK